MRQNARKCTNVRTIFKKILGGGTGLALRRPHRAARVGSRAHFVLHTF